MQEIADGLEAAGYSIWYFERDVIPGRSYLIQITRAIEQCRALVLVISPNALGSDQVTKEVVGAFERGKPFFPVLVGMTPPEFKERQPEWRHALGGTAMIYIGTEGVSGYIARIIDGLKDQGIEAEGTQPVASPLGPSFSTPASYTPQHLAEKILAARSSIEGERKQITVLFADVTGFTSISEKLDPEEVHDLITECLGFLTEEIHRYEGTIAQFLGDGVMALFGAPIAHEDAPQRALYSALGIQERLRVYADQQRLKGIEFDMRIGLNTGLVVVGRIGDDLRMDYTAMGDTVNLASRMESIAEPGTIQVTDNTHRVTEGYFEFQPLGEVQVKGKEEPVKTYRVLGLGPARTRLAAGVLRGLTPFVGRKRELEHLKDCYDKAKEGHGQVVGIVGEPGVGKSRILLELMGTLAQEEYIYLEGRCLHYGEAMPYVPILGILRSYFDIEEGEREFIIKKKMSEKLIQLDEKLEGIFTPLQDILSLKVDDEEYLKLDPQQKRERIFEAIRDLFILVSENKPLILAVEDLHWVDKTSEEFLDYLIGSLTGTQILLVLLYRPEYTHQWASKSYYSQMGVDRFSTSTSAKLVQAIFEGVVVVHELRELILNRAAGNPLFIEEFTHTMLENGTIQKKDHEYVLSTKASDIQVPDTIQGIIAARMDRLEDNLKRTMQVASVIGRDFAYRILQTIAGMGEELKSYLLNLQDLEFIYEKSLFPELEYIFKHALTQEVAYNSLLLKRRKEIHEKIGKAIEELYPDKLEEFYEVLAYHYSKSNNSDKAYQYLKLSADKAKRSYSNWEAFHLYKEAIEVLNKLPQTEENKRRGVETRILTMVPVVFLAYPEGSLYILQEGERLSKELGDSQQLANFYSWMGMYYSFKGQPELGIKYSENCFYEAEKVEDIDLMAPTAVNLCVAYHFKGDNYIKMRDVAHKVISLLEETKRQYESFGTLNPYSAMHTYYSIVMNMLGDFRRGHSLHKKGLDFTLEINDINALSLLEMSESLCLVIHKGDGVNGINHAQHAIRYCEEGQILLLLGMAQMGLGWGYYLLGELETAREQVEKGLKIQSDAGMPFFLSLYYCALSMVHFDSGDLESAHSCVEEALKLSQDNKEKWPEGLSRVLLGRTIGKGRESQSAKAEEYILQGINIFEEVKLKPLSSQGYLYLGELYNDNGQKDKALETLKKAEGMMQEMGMDYWLRRTHEVLEKVQV